MSQATFKERFCAKEGLSPEQYAKVVFRSSLYPAARVLRCVLWLKPGHFALDQQFVQQIGSITALSDFEGVAQDFIYDPLNRGLLRHRLHLRVSITRMRRLVRRVML